MTSIVKYCKNGVAVELLCVKGTIFPYREGKLDRSKVVAVDELWKDSKKGDKLTVSELVKAFGPGKTLSECVDIVLADGECSLTTDELRERKEQKRRELVNYIVTNFEGPGGKAYTPSMVDTALTTHKINVDHTKPANVIFEESKKKLEASMTFSPRSGLEQSFTIKTSDLGTIKSIMKKYITGTEIQGEITEVAVNLPPGDYDRMIAVIGKYEYNVGARDGAEDDSDSDVGRDKASKPNIKRSKADKTRDKERRRAGAHKY